MSEENYIDGIRKRIAELPAQVVIPRGMDPRNEWWIMYSPAIVNTLLDKLAARDEAIVKPWREAVEKVQWVKDDDGFPYCPLCCAGINEGHRVGCDFRALLNRKEAE